MASKKPCGTKKARRERGGGTKERKGRDNEGERKCVWVVREKEDVDFVYDFCIKCFHYYVQE